MASDLVNSNGNDGELRFLRERIGFLEDRLTKLEALTSRLAPSAVLSSETSEPLKDDHRSPNPPTRPFLVRKVEDDAKLQAGVSTELEISDAVLIQTLREEIGKYPGVDLSGNLVIMTNPFSAIVHNLASLERRIGARPDGKTEQTLADLLEAVKTTPELEEFFRMREVNKQSRSIKFDILWTIFPPGALIVAKPFIGTLQLLRVADVSATQSAFFVWAWQWDWTGKTLTKVKYRLKIDLFRGTREVTALPYYPLSHYDEDLDALLDTIRDSSLRFIKATARCPPSTSATFFYQSLAYAHFDNIIPQETQVAAAAAPKLVSIKGDIICDAEAFLQYGWGCPPLGELCSKDQVVMDENQDEDLDVNEFSYKISRLNLEESLDPGDEDFLLLSPRLLGYATKERAWVQFKVDSTNTAKGKSPDKFNTVLQLDDKYKKAITALITSYDRKKENPLPDVVKDKAKGLTIVLHGPPGVGKTLTVETLAEATGKPLLVASVSEVGFSPSKAEQYFERMYTLAMRWGAILLVDEADVFLERRMMSDLARNALLSVFLRLLEYSRAIIIMTTNRVGTFDEATLSRVNLMVYYKKLTPLQAQKVFEYFLDNLSQDVEFDRDELLECFEDVAERLQNGRDIRNMVSLALSFARADRAEPGTYQGRKETLRVYDFRSAIRMMNETTEYIESVHGLSVDSMAREERLR